MNFNTLKYVVTVAEERNFTKAAQKLYVSQPTLSQNIQTLENKLGVLLFDRSTVPLTLTYAGKTYVEWAQQMLLSESQMNRKINSISSGPKMRLTIGIAPHRSSFMLIKTAKAITEEFPSCTFTVEDSIPDNELYDLLYNNKIDLMIGEASTDTIRFTNHYVTEEQLLIAVPHSYGITEAANKGKSDDYPALRLSELKDKPFIMMPPKTYLGKSIRALSEMENFSPIYGIECHNVSTAHCFTDAGLGSTLIPELVVRLDEPKKNIDYFTIAKRNTKRDISIIHRSNSYLTDPAKCFIDFFINEYSSLSKQSKQ